MRFRIIGFILCIAGLLFFQPLWPDAHPVASAKLQMIEIKQRQTQTILIFTLQKNTSPNFFTLENPDRLVMDLPSTRASSVLPKDIKSNGLIQRVRLGNGPSGPGNLRLVMDLAAKMQYIYLIDQNTKKNIQTITVILTKIGEMQKPATEEPTPAYHEALDLADLEKQTQSEKTQKAVQNIGSLSTGQADLIQSSKKTNYTAVQNSPLKKVIVMIDPGHGGKDSGAIGPNRDMEKTVVLSISKKLQALLNQDSGIDARLTRKGDYFVTLRNRLNIARHNHAQMFMAIHADAFNDTAEGASVFALSQHGATSEAARWLAERENTSELSGINIKTTDKELKSVLIDMSQTATIQDSLSLGNALLASLKPLTPLHSVRVEQAGFVVLKSPDIPSVLVETGFISNPKEEKLLTSKDYQNRLAAALSQGILNYFKKNPPPGSLFEMQYK